jgi:hypothetical protein
VGLERELDSGLFAYFLFDNGPVEVPLRRKVSENKGFVDLGRLGYLFSSRAVEPLFRDSSRCLDYPVVRVEFSLAVSAVVSLFEYFIC